MKPHFSISQTQLLESTNRVPASLENMEQKVNVKVETIRGERLNSIRRDG